MTGAPVLLVASDAVVALAIALPVLLVATGAALVRRGRRPSTGEGLVEPAVAEPVAPKPAVS
ncbi:MAG TPA: hypothetical protein VMB82_04235, partial [Acidimicrobiales bacterium]|nr:hypothetical protein [Acidimicrobiales bacterium]